MIIDRVAKSHDNRKLFVFLGACKKLLCYNTKINLVITVKQQEVPYTCQ
jgi:hypothetical protein